MWSEDYPGSSELSFDELVKKNTTKLLELAEELKRYQEDLEKLKDNISQIGRIL